MLLPKRGEYDGVWFNYIRWSIYSHGYEYRISQGDGSKLISVNTLTQLKSEVEKFRSGGYEVETSKV